MQLAKFAVAAVVAGLGDERGGLGGLGLRLHAGGFFAGEGGGHVEGEAGALKRQVREVEPHLLAGDVLHLGEIGADALDQVRLAGSGAAAPVRRAGEEGLEEKVGSASLAEIGDRRIEGGGGRRVAERILRAAYQQVTNADMEWSEAPTLSALADVKLIAAASKCFRRVAATKDYVSVTVALL